MNTKTRVAAPQVPGEPVAETVVQAEAEVTAETSTAGENSSGETVVVEKGVLEALMAQMQALKAQVQTLEAAPVQTRRANPNAELPDQNDVDPATLKSPVLTKQGWVVPEKFGSNPAQKAL